MAGAAEKRGWYPVAVLAGCGGLLLAKSLFGFRSRGKSAAQTWNSSFPSWPRGGSEEGFL